MAQMGFWFYAVLVLFLIVCVFLMLLVLIQKGRGGGLASAFGGMGGNTAFGSKTGDVLTWATSIVFGIFILLAIALNLLANRAYANHLATLRANGITTTDMPAAPVEPTPAPMPMPVSLPPSTQP